MGSITSIGFFTLRGLSSRTAQPSRSPPGRVQSGTHLSAAPRPSERTEGKEQSRSRQHMVLMTRMGRSFSPAMVKGLFNPHNGNKVICIKQCKTNYTMQPFTYKSNLRGKHAEILTLLQTKCPMISLLKNVADQ